MVGLIIWMFGGIFLCGNYREMFIKNIDKILERCYNKNTIRGNSLMVILVYGIKITITRLTLDGYFFVKKLHKMF
jgi:hypothetical protein